MCVCFVFRVSLLIHRSHAAVVARGWGKPCICGCADLEIHTDSKTLIVRPPTGSDEERIIIKEGLWY